VLDFGAAASKGIHASSSSTKNRLSPALSGSGTTDFIPLWTSSTNLGNSILFQTGGNIGVNTKTPGAKLDTAGTAIAMRGSSTGATGTGVAGIATSTTGVNYGVQGQTASTGTFAAGVNGFSTATTGQVFGVSGTANSTTTNAMGVSGYEGAAKGQSTVSTDTPLRPAHLPPALVALKAPLPARSSASSADPAARPTARRA
jgi:hypothetical protein